MVNKTTNIGIFTGLEKTHNLTVLNLLFENGPLSIWTMTSKIQNQNRQALHATLNKRLRKLAKKGYVIREDRKWYLTIKGIIATLLSQSETKMWNPIWNDINNQMISRLQQMYDKKQPKITIGAETIPLMEIVDESVILPKTFDNWVKFSQIVKKVLPEYGIDLDKIPPDNLMKIISIEECNNQRMKEILSPDKVKF